MPGLAHTRTTGPGDTPTGRGDLAGFRRELYSSLTARADALFELTEAVLCTEGPVASLVELTLVVEHRRGHGAMYDALNAGRVEPERLTAAPPAGNFPSRESQRALQCSQPDSSFMPPGRAPPERFP
jgi:hypothetical protein